MHGLRHIRLPLACCSSCSILLSNTVTMFQKRLLYCLFSSAPSVRIAPPAIILLPNETQVTLRCITNNPTLLVFWFGGSLDSQQIISSVPEFNLVVPPEGVPNGMRYYCAVRDPENPSIEVGNRLALAVAELTNIPGRLMHVEC